MTRGRKTSSLGRRIIVNFCLFTLVLSALYTAFSFVFLYTVEDEFLGRELRQEGQYLLENRREDGSFPTPRKAHITVYLSPVDFPADLKKGFLEGEDRIEYFGEEGRHYHLFRFYPDQEIYLVAEVSRHLIIRPLTRPLLITLGFTALIMTLIACFIAYRLAKRTISPLTQLADLVQDADPNRLPNSFADVFPRNEIGVLAQALEASMARTRDFIEREQHFNRDVSHDLRTPLAVVGGAVELLRRSKDLTEEDKALLSRIEKANRQMSQTVEVLLALAREEGRNQPDESIPVLPIVEKIILQNAGALEGKKVEVVTSIDPLDCLNTQKGVLDILLSNLIGNAFEYTREGQVEIAVEGDTLTIRDTAGGIDAEIRDKVTAPMVKGRGSAGFGLGLSIVQRLCEHHGLELDISSDHSGTTIGIRFPQ